jgi:hypothetical protein
MKNKNKNKNKIKFAGSSSFFVFFCQHRWTLDHLLFLCHCQQLKQLAIINYVKNKTVIINLVI